MMMGLLKKSILPQKMHFWLVVGAKASAITVISNIEEKEKCSKKQVKKL